MFLAILVNAVVAVMVFAAGMIAWISYRERQSMTRKVKALTRQLAEAKEENVRLAGELKECRLKSAEQMSRLRHDIRGPLTAIAGFSALLKEVAGISPKHGQYVDSILAATGNLTNMTRNGADTETVAVSGPEGPPHAHQ